MPATPGCTSRPTGPTRPGTSVGSTPAGSPTACSPPPRRAEQLGSAHRSADQAAAEAVRHRLGPVVDSQLAEQPAGVRLHGVLGQEQLATDLAVALALRHPDQDLLLPFGQPDVG